MKTLLATSFGLWGRETYNSTEEILRKPVTLDDADWTVATCCLPVSWTDGPSRLAELLTATPRPDAVVCFGMSGGRTVRCETTARNETASDLADADGRFAPATELIRGAPTTLSSNLPLGPIMNQLTDAGIPCEISHDAGRFLCNAIFFHLMSFILRENPNLPAGFIHLPHFESEGGLPRPVLERAVSSIINVTAEATYTRPSPASH